MALSDFANDSTVARSRRGEIAPNLGAKAIVDTKTVKPQSSLPAPIQKVSDLGKQIGDIGVTIGKKTAGFVANTGIDIVKAGYGTALTARDYLAQPILNQMYSQQSEILGKKQDQIMQDYKAGRMSKQQYRMALDDLNGGFQEINRSIQKDILDGPTPVQRATDVTETAVNLLSLGSLGLAEAGGKQALQAGGKEAVSALVDQSATKFESALLKFPAFKSLVVRNIEKDAVRTGQKLAGETTSQFLVRDGRKIAADLLIKRPIVYQSNIGQAQSMYNNILEGDYKGALTDAAWLGSQMVEGGPLGFIAKNASLAKSGIKKLAVGRGSIIDELSKEIGDGNPAQIARFIQKTGKKLPDNDLESVFRIGTETNLKMSGESVQRAVQNILTHYDQRGIPRDSISPGMIYRDWKNWQKGAELADQIDKIAFGGEGKVVAGAWDQRDRQAIISTLLKAGDSFQDKANALTEMGQRPGVAWGQNHLLVNKLEETLNNAYRAGGDQAAVNEALDKGIRAIDAGAVATERIPKKLLRQMADLGYVPVEPVGGRITPIITDMNETRKLVTGAIKGDKQIFDAASEPEPVLASIAGFLEKAGLSPREANVEATRRLSESMVASLDQLEVGKQLGLKSSQGGDIIGGGQAVLSRLQRYVENLKPNRVGNALVGGKATGSAVNDIRQLTPGEIKDALGLATMRDAKDVSHAIMNAYSQVPLELRGMGDKIVDTLYKYNPLHKYYSRIQSALRYTYNPFFRTQERVETKLLSHVQASNLVWNKSKDELNAAAKVLDDSGILSSSLSGEAAQDQILGRITANITQAQKRDLAGLALDMANSRGVTIEQMAREHADELDDALRVVVQYPRHGVLASPLARTLNLAFFPVRYNAKVTLLAAKALSKQPPTIQKAVLHSLFSFKDWLKSDEGIIWQSKHSDALQVFSWLTPINSIQSTFKLLGRPNSISDVGLLGGLPLGVITQMLDSQGIVSMNKPYQDPKTGAVVPKYVPESAKARAATALQDLLGSMFTYPGRTLGLPGKTAAIRGIVKDFIDTNGSDFSKQVDTANLTPLQQNMMRVLQGQTDKESIDALYNSPAPGSFQGHTIPPLTLPMRPPKADLSTRVPQRKGLPSKKGSKGKNQKTFAQPLQ